MKGRLGQEKSCSYAVGEYQHSWQAQPNTPLLSFAIISAADGKPFRNYEKRLRRILQQEQATDLNQGHDFTIPDIDITQAQEEGHEAFLKDGLNTQGEEHAP